MIKNSVVALVAAAALVGLAAPAMADSIPESQFKVESFDSDFVLYQLQADGVAATEVEEWGEYVRAFVTAEDGSQTMRLFDADTLAPVSL